VWIDCAPSAENLAWLKERFDFHPLALEDCEVEDQRPKLDPYPNALFLVVHRLALAPDDVGVVPLELDTFLTGEALVTVHNAPVAEVDRTFERCAADPAQLARGPDFALYLLLDAFIDAHYTLVDALTEHADAFADAVSGPDGARESEELLGDVVASRRAHSALRRKLAPQREVFLALARPGQPFVKEQTALYFRDVVDHAIRITEEVDAGRDLLASTMDVLLSRTNNRLSKVTARLTLAATIFLPLNFLAGFFGMNLEILRPHLAIPVVLGAMVILPVVMVVWFRRSGWI
jgi:magnesium transporter